MRFGCDGRSGLYHLRWGDVVRTPTDPVLFFHWGPFVSGIISHSKQDVKSDVFSHSELCGHVLLRSVAMLRSPSEAVICVCEAVRWGKYCRYDL